MAPTTREVQLGPTMMGDVAALAKRPKARTLKEFLRYAAGRLLDQVKIGGDVFFGRTEYAEKASDKEMMARSFHASGGVSMHTGSIGGNLTLRQLPRGLNQESSPSSGRDGDQGHLAAVMGGLIKRD